MHATNQYPGIYGTNILKPFMPLAINAEKRFVEAVYLKTDEIIELEKGIYTLDPSVTDIQTFKHPIYSERAKAVLIDARPFYNKDGRPKNLEDRANLMTRARLELMWKTGGDSYNSITVPVSAFFGYWVSQTIGGRTGIDAADKDIINICMFTYYMFMFKSANEQETMNVNEFSNEILRGATQLTRLDYTIVRNIVENKVFQDMLKYFKDSKSPLEEVINTIRKLISIEVFSIDGASFILTLSRGAWLGGIDAEILAATAIQHPPSLVYLMNLSLTVSRYAAKSNIGKTAAAVQRRFGLDSIPNFVKVIGG